MDSIMAAGAVAEQRGPQESAKLQHEKTGQLALLFVCATAILAWLGFLGWGAGWLIKLW
jgi:hypothetical protein